MSTVTAVNENKPTVSPELLRHAGLQGDMEVKHGFLLEFTEGYGCGGIEETFHVFLEKGNHDVPWGIADVRTLVDQVEKTVKERIGEAKAVFQALLPPAPKWDSSWTGTFGEWEEANTAYKVLSSKPAWSRTQLMQEAWGEAGGTILTISYPVVVVNSNDSDVSGEPLTEKGVRALAFHTEHGCRCCGTSRWGLLDEEDELESEREGYSPVMFQAPPVSFVTTEGGWGFVINGWREKTEMTALLQEFATEWEEKETAQVRERTELESEIAALAKKEDLALMTYAEYEARKGDPNKLWGLRVKLQNVSGEYGVALDTVSSPLRITLPGIRARNSEGWLVNGRTVGGAWVGQKSKKDED